MYLLSLYDCSSAAGTQRFECAFWTKTAGNAYWSELRFLDYHFGIPQKMGEMGAL